MDEINLHEYTIEDGDKYSSDFLNQVISDFTGAITGLYVDYKALVNRYNDYISVVNAGLDWQVEQVGILASGDYTVSAYSTPESNNDVDIERLFGMLYLQTSQTDSKISRYEDSQGVNRAFVSNKVYRFVDSTWTEEEDLRTIIDNEDYIWSNTYADDEIYLAVYTSATTSTDQKANIIEVVPFAGTTIKRIEYKNSSGTFESVTFNSALPARIIGDLSYADEFRVVLGGVPRDGQYYYSLRYANVFKCNFADIGSATYNVGVWSAINTITMNSDYIEDELKLDNPVQIEVISEDGSNTFYDSYDSENNSLPVTMTEQALKLRVTLNKTQEVTPVIKYIDLA